VIAAAVGTLRPVEKRREDAQKVQAGVEQVVATAGAV
jgi:hypothetical protein